MTQRYVVLRGIEENNVFWSSMGPGKTEDSIRYLNDGTLAYDVLLITEDAAEAQAYCTEAVGLVADFWRRIKQEHQMKNQKG